MEKTQRTEMKLVGIAIRTNNQNEMNPSLGKIGPTIYKYDAENISAKIPHRKQPGVTYCVYTDYESDHTGEYTYFVGEEVNACEQIPEGLQAITIPAQQYLKITSAPGPMPQVCIQLWQTIWADTQLATERAYRSDFEVYDQRARDPNNTVLDIYISV